MCWAHAQGHEVTHTHLDLHQCVTATRRLLHAFLHDSAGMKHNNKPWHQLLPSFCNSAEPEPADWDMKCESVSGKTNQDLIWKMSQKLPQTSTQHKKYKTVWIKADKSVRFKPQWHFHLTKQRRMKLFAKRSCVLRLWSCKNPESQTESHSDSQGRGRLKDGVITQKDFPLLMMTMKGAATHPRSVCSFPNTCKVLQKWLVSTELPASSLSWPMARFCLRLHLCEELSLTVWGRVRVQVLFWVEWVLTWDMKSPQRDGSKAKLNYRDIKRAKHVLLLQR